MSSEQFVEVYNLFYMGGKVQITDIEQINDWENKKAFMELGIKHWYESSNPLMNDIVEDVKNNKARNKREGSGNTEF